MKQEASPFKGGEKSHEESAELLEMRKTLQGVPLKSALRSIFANIIRVEERLSKLNKTFHLRYHSALHLGMWRGDYRSTSEFTEATWLPLLQIYAHEITTEHTALAAYLLGQGLRSMIRSVQEDMPEQLQSSVLLDSLVTMAMACLRPSDLNSPRTQ